jgi:hypothetical protein
MPTTLLLVVLSARPAAGAVLILTYEQAVHAADVRIDPDGSVVAVQESVVAQPPSAVPHPIPASEVMLIAFDPPPRAVEPRAWLCLQDGQRISGDALAIGPRQITLKAQGLPDLEVPREQLAAVFFKTARPLPHPPPAEGVRIIATNNDVLDVPAVEWTEHSLIVDIDPNVDPIILSLDRVAGVLWPVQDPVGTPVPHRSTDAAAVSHPDPEAAAPGSLVELRTGERLRGRISSFDERALTLHVDTVQRVLPRPEIVLIWFGSRSVHRLAEVIAPETPTTDRPRYRLDRNALGDPIRIGERVYPGGIGIRGPATVDIPVPEGAKWLVAHVGADTGAAAFARMSLEIRADGQPRWQRENTSPGDPPERVAVPLAGARAVTLSVQPAGDDPTGCLGDFANAVFVK